MKKSASMRPDILLVTTQGVRGGKKHSNLQGNCTLKVTKGFNEPEDNISVDVFEGYGHTYKPAETASINITFADGQQWNGNFEKLKGMLFNESFLYMKGVCIATLEDLRNGNLLSENTESIEQAENNLQTAINNL